MSVFLMCQKNISSKDEAGAYLLRCERNLKEDVKTAIDLAFEMKEKIQELHPGALELFMKMISN